MSNNKILDYIIKQRNGHYCHALELESACDYECVIESLIGELKEQFAQDDFINFFDSIELYYQPDVLATDEWIESQEIELYNFDYKQFINDCY